MKFFDLQNISYMYISVDVPFISTPLSNLVYQIGYFVASQQLFGVGCKRLVNGYMYII